MAGFLMLAEPANEDKLEFPMYASPKLDGIRGSVEKGILQSRSMKPIRNAYVQYILGDPSTEGLDGELIVGPNNAEDVFNKSSAVNKKDGEPDFIWYIFDDRSDESAPFEVRIKIAKRRVTFAAEMMRRRGVEVRIELLDHVLIYNEHELETYEAECLANGFEGVMIRRLHMPYKRGRSTALEGHLNKLKRFEHAEAVIIGYEELMNNNNEAFLDELGRTKRSSTKEGLSGAGSMGAYIVKSEDYEKPFKISCGSMKAGERVKAWETRDEDVGKIARYKFFPKGIKDVPRHGLWAGFRDPDDLS